MTIQPYYAETLDSNDFPGAFNIVYFDEYELRIYDTGAGEKVLIPTMSINGVITINNFDEDTIQRSIDKLKDSMITYIKTYMDQTFEAACYMNGFYTDAILALSKENCLQICVTKFPMKRMTEVRMRCDCGVCICRG